MKSTFANNIKSLRIDNDYSQNDLAKALGITRSRYSNYENGISEPNIEILIKISRFFNCSIDDLLKSKINTVIKNKIDSIISKKPEISVSLNEFDYSSLKENLVKNRSFYEEKKKTILNEIDIKISELDSILNFINNLYNEEYSSEISSNIINFRDKEKNINYRSINLLGKISAGNPCYAHEEIIDSFNIPSNLLCPSKDYFILKVKGDSMNKLYSPNDLILIERTNLVNNDDIIIAIIGEEATCKKIHFSPNEIILTPQSTNPVHQVQIYKYIDIHILGKVLGKLSDYIKE